MCVSSVCLEKCCCVVNKNAVSVSISVAAVLRAAEKVVRPNGQHVSGSVPNVSVVGSCYWPTPGRRGRLRDTGPGRLYQAGTRARGGDTLSEPRHYP